MDADKAQLQIQFGQRVRAARQKKNLTQQAIADMLSISPSHYSNIEMGKVNVGLDILYRLATILDVSVDGLLMLKVPDRNGVGCYDAVIQLFADCTPSEADMLYKIVSEVKQTLRTSPDKKS